MVFTSVKKDTSLAVGLAGKVDTSFPHVIVTKKLNLSSSQDYTAGAPLKLNSDGTVQPYVNGDSVTPENYAGIGVLDLSKPMPDTGAQYVDADEVSVMQFGVVFGSGSAAMTAGQRVACTPNGGLLTCAHSSGTLAAGTQFLPGVHYLLDSGNAGAPVRFFVPGLAQSTGSVTA